MVKERSLHSDHDCYHGDHRICLSIDWPFWGFAKSISTFLLHALLSKVTRNFNWNLCPQVHTHQLYYAPKATMEKPDITFSGSNPHSAIGFISVSFAKYRHTISHPPRSLKKKNAEKKVTYYFFSNRFVCAVLSNGSNGNSRWKTKWVDELE